MREFCGYCLTVCFLLVNLQSVVQGEEIPLPSAVGDASISIVGIEGKKRFPFKLDGAKAITLIFVTHDCPISNAYSPELARIKQAYDSKGINMILVFVDPDVAKKEIQEHMRDYSLSGYTAVIDRTHKLVKETGATVTPEAVVVLRDGSIAYRGRIDNMYPALGQRRRVISEKDLRNALNAIIENREIETQRTQAVGCYIPNLQ